MKKLELLKLSLLSLVDNIDSGNTHLDEDQCDMVIETINKMALVKNKYSKYQSYNYLGLSRATFDRYVKDGLIPEGRKEAGFKEKFWYKKDLDEARNNILRRNNSNSNNSNS